MWVVTPQDGEVTAVGHEGHRYGMVDYLGSPREARPGEQAYLVRQFAPELRAHFHEVDQFQVVLEGHGTLGRDDACPGVLHYTDAWTSYGPIRTRPEVGLGYLTLRRVPTTGINYMPEGRERRQREARRAGEHFTVAVSDSVSPGATPAELASTGRGVAAYDVRPAAGAPLPVEGIPSGRSGYAVVLTGSLEHAGRTLPAGSLLSFESSSELVEHPPVAVQDSIVAALLFPPEP